MEESGHGKSGKVPTGKKETTTSVGICGTGRVAGRRPGSKSPTPLVGYVIRRGVPAEAKTLQPERQELLGLLDDVLAGLDQVLGVLLVDLEDFLVAEVVDLGAGFVKGLLNLPAAVMACQEAFTVSDLTELRVAETVESSCGVV